MSEPRRIDPVEQAHLRDARGFSPPVHRFAPAPGLAAIARRYWLPVWSLPAGEVSVQRVLRYPVCLLVVTDAEARFYGPATGMSTQELRGSGWACGVMLQPAAGSLLLGGPVSGLTDGHVPVETLGSIDGARLVERIHAAMGRAPDDADHQRRAVTAMEETLAGLPEVDEEGHLVNAIVEHVEIDPTVLRVGQICTKFALTERTLQRLTARRIGLSPKWLVQRRRLQEAAARLAAGEPIARIAGDLGYTDQAHLTRDFRAVTGQTPGSYAAEPRA